MLSAMQLFVRISTTFSIAVSPKKQSFEIAVSRKKKITVTRTKMIKDAVVVAMTITSIPMILRNAARIAAIIAARNKIVIIAAGIVAVLPSSARKVWQSAAAVTVIMIKAVVVALPVVFVIQINALAAWHITKIALNTVNLLAGSCFSAFPFSSSWS